mgnify:CR=1 FL=1
MAFESDFFANLEILVDALKEIGFEQITVGTDLLLEGWDKSDKRVADVIIRRSNVKHHHLLGDIGFQRTAQGFVPVIDDLDLKYRLGKNFITRLQTQYHEVTARKMAAKLGGTILREHIGKTIKIRIKY